MLLLAGLCVCMDGASNGCVFTHEAVNEPLYVGNMLCVACWRMQGQLFI
jgi:hypothetical protein